MTPKGFGSAALAACLGICCSHRSSEEYPGAPIVLISIDTLRSDHLPAYGYRKVATPNIDRLRKDSVLFLHAFSHVPLTLPSHASLLSGLLPFEHGVRDNIGYRLDAKRHPTLATLLKARGYATMAAVSAWVLRGSTGVGEGFDFFEDNIVAPGGVDTLARVRRPGRDTLALVAPRLGAVKDRPFFLFFHVYEPHAPYEPPEPFKSRFPLPYDGEIALADDIVGELLDQLRSMGVYDRAVIVLLSDHGEGLGEHGEEDHGILLYRWALQVPLLLKLPNSLRGGTSAASPVALVDVLPTLLKIVGLPVPKGLPGQSLLGDLDPGRKLYAETFYPRIHLGWSPLRSLLDGRWHYVEGRRRELFSLGDDPGELQDLLSSEGGVARSMQKDLAAFPSEAAPPSSVTSEQRERLGALGYLSSAVQTTGPLPDPSLSIHVLKDVKAAFRLAAAGRDAEAAEDFRRILADFPTLFDARYALAQALERLGRTAEAYEEYKTALRTSPSLVGPLSVSLARVALRLKRVDESDQYARLALEEHPAEAHAALARVALARDDLEAAEREAKAATGETESELIAAVIRAEVAIRRDRVAEALAILESAKAKEGERGIGPIPDLDFLRGDSLARLGRNAEAESAFQEEIRNFPASSPAYARLAIVYGLEHRTLGEVDRLLEAMVRANPTGETRELAAKTLDSLGDPQGAARWRPRTRGDGPVGR